MRVGKGKSTPKRLNMLVNCGITLTFKINIANNTNVITKVG
ncbi:Uncharacterised protein [Vibrio cholerae]|nr:Uncharacterised protein [Vibrio cholerae]